MIVTMMKGKIHRATVTEADLHYEGSISIDRDLHDVSWLVTEEEVDERVLVVDLLPVERGNHIVGLDAGILMHPRVWEASGHVATFADPLDKSIPGFAARMRQAWRKS